MYFGYPLVDRFGPTYVLTGQTANQAIGQGNGGLGGIRFLLTSQLICSGLLKVRGQLAQLLLEALCNGNSSVLREIT